MITKYVTLFAICYPFFSLQVLSFLVDLLWSSLVAGKLVAAADDDDDDY